MNWLPEKMEMLRMLWDEGLPASAIAEKLGDGVSRNAVIGKAHRLGLEARPSPVKGADDVPSEGDGDSTTEGGTIPARRVSKSRAKPVKIVRTTLLDLSDKVCKWPIGHPGDTDFHFCGQPSQAGFPYCSAHCAVAYQAQMPRRDRPNRPLPPVRIR